MPSFHVLTDDLPEGVMVIEVRLTQLLDEQSEGLRREMAALLKENKPRLAVLDLSRVTVISSLGVGVVVSLLKRVREQGGELVLCGLTPMVEEVFRICQLISSDENVGGVKSTRTVEEALAAGPRAG
jgi:stage II sporulation protein AA (anti-sigma F factor antagonist)